MKIIWGTDINMPTFFRCLIVAVFIFTMVLPARSQQYHLYVPQPAPSGQSTPVQDGILVQEVEIQKADTLYDLSRKFSGHGMYYPQILLFNSIKKPNLIYPGNTLKIPVNKNFLRAAERVDTKSNGAPAKAKTIVNKKSPRKTEMHPPSRKSSDSSPASSPSTEISLSDLKTVGPEKIKGDRFKNRTPGNAKKLQTHDSSTVPSPSSQIPVVHSNKANGQKLFDAAIKAYRQDDCRTALELLDSFLENNPGSPLAADANLYKAECYLKLSSP
jgi:hypothetical protein